MKSQFGTSSLNNSYGGIRKLPYVFTEQGVAMLATVLRTSAASKMSVEIMRAFVLMIKYINNSLIEYKNMNNMLLRHDNEIKILQESFDKFKTKEKINHIFYDGQIYDAYSLLIDILRQAKKEIVIIDNYIDKTILDIITSMNINVVIITNKYNKIDIEKYNKQYNNLSIRVDNTFHDRFILIDKSILYHCGASFKDLGIKCFAINKIKDEYLVSKIINKLK